MTEKRWRPVLLLTVCLLSCLLLSGCGGKAETAKTVVILEDSPTPVPAENSGTTEESSWYGWWKMVDTSGDWARMHGYWWDCCAQLCEDGSLLIWDEDLSKENYLAKLIFRAEGNSLTVTGGSFMDKELGAGDLSIVLTEDKNGSVMTVSGRYTADNSKGGFRLEMVLRPWGTIWQCPEDELPYYYTDWYLPLIESGKAMPDTIGK